MQENKRQTWYARLKQNTKDILITTAIAATGVGMLMLVKRFENNERNQVKKKLKYFNPTIHEGIFGKTVTWTGREKPLTDEELKNLL